MFIPMESMCLIPDHVQSKRVSSYDRTGNNKDFVTVKAGERFDLACIDGAGYIKHIWMTLGCEDPMIRRNAVIRMYWDGSPHPSVEAPLGDFFGQGWGEKYLLNSLPLAASPAEGTGLNCYFVMPFGVQARIEIENKSDRDIRSLYYYVDYELHRSIPAAAGRFHAWWNRELTEVHPEEGETEWGIVGPQGDNRSDRNNYLIADIQGKGRFVGINYYVDNPGPMWYGEGDDMWLIDGEEWPGSLHGTGTEDMFNSSWCPNEIYMHPYFGYARIPKGLGWMGRTHCYRFMAQDSVHFDKSLRVSIEHGHDNNLTLDLCTVAYWYQIDVHKPFPAFPPKEKRQNMPPIRFEDVHMWRHEYRKAHGSGKTIWGNEWRNTDGSPNP